MSHDPEAWNGEHPGELLSLHVDGDLEDEARRRVDEHLETCPRCRRVAAELEELAERAGRLPDRGPEEDLWPAIAGQMAAGEDESRAESGGHESGPDGVIPLFRRRWQVGPARAVAAAALVAALASGVTWGVVRGGGPGDGGAAPGPVATSSPPGSTAVPASAGAGSAVRWATLEATPRGVADLEARYRAAREELDPATRRMLDRNLRLIDRAIAEAQRALSEHPDNSYLHQHLTQTMRRKAEFLSVAVRMTEAD